MVFRIEDKADPLVQQVEILISSAASLENLLRQSMEFTRSITVSAAEFLDEQIGTAFFKLTARIVEEGKTRVDEAGNIIDAIIQNARIDFGTVTDFIDVAAEDARVEALRQAELTRREIATAAAFTAAELAKQAEETNFVLDNLGDILGAGISALPGGIGLALGPIFDQLQESLTSGDAALGDGFGFLGASNLLGFSAIGDILTNIFNIDPEQFAKGFEGMMPFMADIAKNVGDEIIAVGE